MLAISDDFIKENINCQSLIKSLKAAFKKQEIRCPAKINFDYSSSQTVDNNKMMLMPAWDNQDYFGIKLITATPDNYKTAHAYLNGTYLLFDAKTGMPIASMDAKLMTHIRTAATSVLASMILAKQNARSVMIIGNGNIAAHYIDAYASIDTVDTIYIWGRRYDKSVHISDAYTEDSCHVIALKEFEETIHLVDIVSCITSAKSPIILPQHLSKNQHYDLAGSYTTDMIEMYVDAVAQCSIYVDNMEVTPTHAGELYHAIQEAKISLADIQGSLSDICNDESIDRVSDGITLFKSTGMGLEDLVLASMIYEKYIQS